MNDPTPQGATPWHASVDLLERYATLELDVSRSASVEQHVLECASCRTRLQVLTYADEPSASDLEAVWLEVIDDVDRPRVGVVRSVLQKVGFSDRLASVVAATPALRLSWMASIIVALGFALAAAVHPQADDTLLLIVAPLIPLAGIGAAYGTGVDPLHELARAAPFPTSRVFLYRSLAVLCTAVPLTLFASLLLPVDGWAAVGWLLPSLGLVGFTLALSTWTEPMVAALVTGAGWFALLLTAWVRASRFDGATLAAALPFRPAGQAVFAAVAVAGALVFWARLARFDTADSLSPEVR